MAKKEASKLGGVSLEEMEFNDVSFTIDEGARDNTLSSYAGKIFNSYAVKDWERCVLPELMKINETKCNPPLSESDVRKVFKSIGGKELRRRNKMFELEKVPTPFTREEKKERLVITTAEELHEKEYEEPPFIIDRLVPQVAITEISAESGKGKSLFALFLAKHIATGETMFENFQVKKTESVSY